MKAVYLKSIKSPVAPGRFKLKYDYDRNVDVFSQIPKTEEYSEYLEDSFCVNSDYEDTECLQDDGNDTLMMMPQRKPKKKRPKASTAKGRTRILKTADSSSEDDTNGCTRRLDQTQCTSHPRNRENRLGNRIQSSSTSTSDESFLRRKSAQGNNRFPSSTSSSSPGVYSPAVTGMAYPPPTDQIMKHDPKLGSIPYKDRAIGANSFRTEMASPPFTRLKPNEDISQRKNSNLKVIPNPVIESMDTSAYCNTSSAKESKVPSHVDAPSKSSHKEGLSREERIKLAKMKQESFRKKQTSTSDPIISISSAEGQAGRSTSCLPTNTHTTHQNLHRHAKPIILVDSKELSSGQDIVSRLRLKHKMEPVVRSLGTCDYIVSNRMAVERKFLSDFTNGAYRARLISRVRTMLETFDRVTIIVERDRVKTKSASSKNAVDVSLMKSKYVEQTISWLSQVTSLKIVYTDNQEDTSDILYELSNQESRKGSAIKVPVELSEKKEQVLRFYMSLPRMSYVLALNFVNAFNSLNQFIHCPTTSVMSRFQLTKSRVEEMKSHLGREFDQQMLPISRK